jgi:carbonic anhydrase
MCDSCDSPSRRAFLQTAGLGLLSAVALPRILWANEAHAAKSDTTKEKAVQKVTSDEALARLVEGNRRFVANKMFHPNESPEQRTRLTSGQAPFAAILGCADSRVPPEIIFDHGLGDIFDVRVAGNIVEDAGSGSFEYAVEHLGVPLIVVLGHAKCGAVKSTVEALQAGGEVPGHIAELVRKLKPAVYKTKDLPGDKIDNAVRENARSNAAELAGLEPILKKKVQEGLLKVVAMRYDLDTGVVELL